MPNITKDEIIDPITYSIFSQPVVLRGSGRLAELYSAIKLLNNWEVEPVDPETRASITGYDPAPELVIKLIEHYLQNNPDDKNDLYVAEENTLENAVPDAAVQGNRAFQYPPNAFYGTRQLNDEDDRFDYSEFYGNMRKTEQTIKLITTNSADIAKVREKKEIGKEKEIGEEEVEELIEITDADITCPVSGAIFKEPVVLNGSGVLVEKTIADDLLKGQLPCPVTDKPINGYDAAPPLIKNFIALYLDENPSKKVNQFVVPESEIVEETRHANQRPTPPAARQASHQGNASHRFFTPRQPENTTHDDQQPQNDNDNPPNPQQ